MARWRAAQMNLRCALAWTHFRGMESATNSGSDWVQELVEFLRTQPSVSAVRTNPSAQKVAVATIGNVEIAGLDENLADTIAAIEAEFAARAASQVPVGYSMREEGGTVVVGRDHCVTAETMWKWRELDWPEMREEESAEEGEWRKLAWLAAICGLAGIAGALAQQIAPGTPWLAKTFFLIGILAGGWDAAVDTWANLKKREIDIHFLMIAVAVGAMFI